MTGSCGLGRDIVLNPRDVENSTLDRSFGDVFSVQSDSDVHGVASHPHHVVICDVVGFPSDMQMRKGTTGCAIMRALSSDAVTMGEFSGSTSSFQSFFLALPLLADTVTIWGYTISAALPLTFLWTCENSTKRLHRPSELRKIREAARQQRRLCYLLSQALALACFIEAAARSTPPPGRCARADSARQASDDSTFCLSARECVPTR